MCQSVVSKFTAFVVLTGTDALPLDTIRASLQRVTRQVRPLYQSDISVPTLIMQNYLVMGLPKQRAVAVGLAMSLFFRNLPLPLKTYVCPPILSNSYKFENHEDIV